MPKVNDNTTHKRVVTVLFTRYDLTEILTAAALEAAGITHPSVMNVRIDVEDNMEGSPAYRAGSKAKVVLEIDLNPRDGGIDDAD